MKLTESTPTTNAFNQSSSTIFGNSVPHDWLPSPTGGSFGNMTQFNNDIFSTVQNSLSSLSQPQSPIASTHFGKAFDLSPNAATDTNHNANFTFSSTNLPFPGFEFLSGFPTSTDTSNGGGLGGFDAGNVAAWSDFVGTGVFNNVPDQPFSLNDHDVSIVGLSDDGHD